MADSVILPIPSIPPGVKEAINRKKLAVFIGAGVSRIIGCQGWDDLAQTLIKQCQPYLNFRESEILNRYSDHKKAITICYEILKQNRCEEDFFQSLQKSLELDESCEFKHLYHELYKIRGLFITTNADNHFDTLFNPERIICEGFSHEDIDPTKLYHIHGSIDERRSLIFTIKDYIRRYRDSDFKLFLERIFSEYTVLFIGYGMNEFELLDFIITKYGSSQETEVKHYILRPYYSGEETALRFEEIYYRNMGVSVIPYLKDENGYNQLYEVVKKWRDEIKKTSGYTYDTFREIDELVDQYEG